MIDKSQGFKDAPPSYQHVVQSSSTNLANPRAVSNPEATLNPSLPTTGPKRHRTKATASSRWLPTSLFGLSKTAKQVRSTSQSLLRDLLSQARPSEHEWLSVLTSCADACNAQGLNFSSVLQEPFVEGRLPVYWAVLKRPAVPIKADHTTPSGDPDALVLAILDASLPLTAQSVADARLACMTVSDNALFVRLGQRYEGFSQRLGTDKMLLGGGDTVDSVTVDEPHNGGGSFTVQFSLTQFPLRMRVSKLARIEFVARGALRKKSLFLSVVCVKCIACLSRETVAPCICCCRRTWRPIVSPPTTYWGLARLAWSQRAELAGVGRRTPLDRGPFSTRPTRVSTDNSFSGSPPWPPHSAKTSQQW